MAVVTTNLGVITAYGDAVAAGYTGTKAEWQALMASYATVAEEAEDFANKAAKSATDADSAKADAITAKNNAETAKNDAITAKNDAVTAKNDAQTAKTDAEKAKDDAQDIVDGINAKSEKIDQNATEIEELKSEFTALESDGVVPSAEQILTDKGITDSVPYHYRKTGGDGADRLYDQIVGGTVCFNQLMALDDDSWTILSGNVSVSATNGKIVANGTSNIASTTALFPARIYNKIKPIKGHRYLLSVVGKTGFNLGFYIYGNTTQTIGIGVLNGSVTKIFTGNVDTTTDGELVGTFSNGETVTADFCAYLVDLTAMFGSTIADYIYQLEQTTAGAGVAFFKALFPNDYYPYNAGELVSVSGLSEHKMVGFNQWDEEWEVGGIDNGTGQPTSNPSMIRSKNFIKVLPNTTYYFKTPFSYTYVYIYDEDMNFIALDAPDASTKLLTLGGNVHYIKFRSTSGYTTYNHDICINISDPAKNGEYEPYEAHSYPLDSALTLRGIPKLDSNNKLYFDGDTYDADGTVTRKYGIVDLGTLTWKYQSTLGVFYVDNVNAKAVGSCLCPKYVSVAPSNPQPDKSITLGGNGWFTNDIAVVDSAYTDATAFKTAMSGIMLVYELATPTTEEAYPYQHLQQCDPDGTEEYVSTGIVPVGHNSFYPENLRAKVEQLPWNFANLIAPTESTFTATRNYTTGALFIVDNVLYKATSNIANGGTITPNTNCAATTLAEIISALA